MKITAYFKALFSGKIIWAVLLIPFLIQLIFLSLLIPALNNGDRTFAVSGSP